MSKRTAAQSISPETPLLLLSPSAMPSAELQEVSMVEEEGATGVSFTPELWMQRRRWALDVLRKEQVHSILDIGCGSGVLLETLVIPPTTIPEPPIRPLPPKNDEPPSPVDSGLSEYDTSPELFIDRLCGLDPSPSTIPTSLQIIQPPSSSSSSSSFPLRQPRFRPLEAAVWLGGVEMYNSRLEGYEAITMLEVIEHLEEHVLSRFGVVTMGTYRPRLLLVTTPNFDFNAKFPRAEESEYAKKGFMDPTGRTERVFRHSDHKLEMTSGEFRTWAEAAAADWGYQVELGGVGVSNKPSFYPADDPHLPNQPIYATQTAIFRLATVPARSPRSVRSSQLPFMPGSKESSHPHKLAGKFTHPPTIRVGRTESVAVEDVRGVVKGVLGRLGVGKVGIEELWGWEEVKRVCEGSKRVLVGCLGGWGDCESLERGGGEFEVGVEKGRGLGVVWNGFVKEKEREEEVWGRGKDGDGDVKMGESQGGW